MPGPETHDHVYCLVADVLRDDVGVLDEVLQHDAHEEAERRFGSAPDCSVYIFKGREARSELVEMLNRLKAGEIEGTLEAFDKGRRPVAVIHVQPYTTWLH